METFTPKRGVPIEFRLRHLEEHLATRQNPSPVDSAPVTVAARLPDDVPIIDETTGGVTDTDGTPASATPDLETVDHEFAVSSPAQITADQNDYALTSPALYHRLSTDASRNITGFAAPSAAREIVIVNVGSQDIVLTNQDAGSSAANRIITGTGASITLSADETAVLWYDTVTLRWRCGWRSP